MIDLTAKQCRLVLLLATLLPFWRLVTGEDMLVSIQDSEMPVKLWGFVRFWDWRLLWGGHMKLVGFPETGMLNNPDIVATIIVGLLRPFVGLVNAFNLLLMLVMGCNLTSGYFLCRQFECTRWASIVGGIVFGWQPLLVSYGFSSVITDLIHLWPYALGLGLIQRAMLEDNPSDGTWAGICLAFGFITCPYNFVLFVPIIPLLLVWMWYRNPENFWAILNRMGLTGSVLVLIYGLRIGYVMHGESSLVDAEMVDSVRHVFPFEGLQAAKVTRYTAFFGEMFGALPRPVVVMEQVARFYRHFQWAVSVSLVAGIGVFTAKSNRIFFILGLTMGIGASVGPYFTVNPTIEMTEPWNVLYLYAYYLPLGKMILEPFRYVLVAGTFIGLSVAIGVQRFGKWSWLVGAMLIAETFWRSPTLPFPTQSIPWDDRMSNLPISSNGGIVHLPFFVSRSNRFDRSHFVYQLQHDRPISDPIMGFPSPYMVSNTFLCTLIHAETVEFPMEHFPCGRESLEYGIEELSKDNVSAVVLDPDKYSPNDWLNIRSILESGLPIDIKEYRGLFILEPQSELR